MILYALLFLILILISGSLSSRIQCDDFLRMENIKDLKTGDLIFGRHRNLASKLQQWAFGSPINHVAMIVRIEEDLWVWEVDPKTGSCLISFKDYIQSNFDGTHKKPAIPAVFYGLDVPYVVPRGTYTKTALYIKRLPESIDQEKTLAFIEKNLGRPFSFRFWCAAASQTLSFEMPCEFIPEGQGAFCSELIATLYNELGIIRRSPRTVLPLHLWDSSLISSTPMQLIGSLKTDNKIEVDVSSILSA